MTRRDELTTCSTASRPHRRPDSIPVKINAVIERGVNDDEILDLATFGRERGLEIRFIEFMPLDADGHWGNEQVVGQDEIVDTINAVFPIEQMPARGAAPADRFRYLDGGGTVGVIPTVTKPFCGDCDRVRLTAEGDFRTCLFATTEATLLDAIRAGRVRRRDRRPHRGGGGQEVGRPPDQPGQLHPTRQVDEPDRRLRSPAPTGGAVVVQPSVGRPAEPGAEFGVADASRPGRRRAATATAAGRWPCRGSRRHPWCAHG